MKTLPIDSETKLPEFKITIDEKVYTDKKEAAKAFEKAALRVSRVAPLSTPTKIGEFQGFPLSVTVERGSFDLDVLTADLQGAYPHTVKLGQSFSHNLKKLEATLYNIDQKIGAVSSDLAKLRVNCKEAEKIVSEPFENNHNSTQS